MSNRWTWGVYEVRGGWVLAQANEAAGQFQAPMTPQARRVTGCSGVLAASPEGLAQSGNVRVFRSRATPVRLLRAIAREEAEERALDAAAALPLTAEELAAEEALRDEEEAQLAAEAAASLVVDEAFENAAEEAELARILAEGTADAEAAAEKEERTRIMAEGRDAT